MTGPISNSPAGQTEIVRHAHRQGIERLPEGGFQLLETAFQTLEIAADDRLVVRIGGDAHHAAHTHVRKLRKGIRREVVAQLRGIPARLGLLAGDVDLEQDVDHTAAAGRLRLNRLGEAGAVHRMDQLHERRDVLDLVGLQVADHVPLDILGKQLVFLAKLLRAALAEDALSGVVGLADQLRRVGFRDGDQRHPRRQRLPHKGQLGCYFRHGFANFP